MRSYPPKIMIIQNDLQIFNRIKCKKINHVIKWEAGVIFLVMPHHSNILHLNRTGRECKSF